MIPEPTILTGDVIEQLRMLPDASVHCVVTSPPYWGLRDYRTDGQIGLEATPEQYVERMVEVFREVRRVLRDDGTLWLNLGDSYAGSGKGGNPDDSPHVKQRTNKGTLVARKGDRTKCYGYKPKDMMGIPWRVAFALQADGWWLRSDVIWQKPNPMPESVTDRPTKAHEYIFLLTKSARYFFDAEAVKEESGPFKACGPNSRADNDRDPAHGTRKQDALGKNTYTGFNDRWREKPVCGRNIRSVWSIATQAYPDAHFATFPEAIPERCIKAGTSEKGCCAECGAPWVRVVESEKLKRPRPNDYVKRNGQPGTGNSCANSVAGVRNTTTGWQPGCECDAQPAPCTVLDPFAGSGTTLAVAAMLGRKSLGIELNPEYVKMAKDRIGRTLRPSTYVPDRDVHAPLFDHNTSREAKLDT